MKTRKLGVALAVTAALGAGSIGTAHADALAQAYIGVKNFILTDGNGTALDISDFSQLSFLDSLTNTASLNGGVPDIGFAGTNQFVGSLDAAQACVGACVAGENNYTPIAAPPSSTYARSDSLLENQPITGTIFPTGVNASNISETSVTGTNFGTAASDIILTATFQFVLEHDLGEAGIEFDADAYLRAWTGAGTIPPTSAGAGYKWEISIQEQGSSTKIIDWIPNGDTTTGTQVGLTIDSEDCNLDQSASATFNDPQAATVCTDGFFKATSNVVLTQGTPYSLSITQHVITQAEQVEQVPEPASLALLGAGLLGLGAMRRRKA